MLKFCWILKFTKMVYLKYLIFVVLVLFTKQVTCGAEPKREPPFPHLFDVEQQIEKHRLHILSESVGDDIGYETIEEYVDFDIRRATLMINSKNGRRTTHIDAGADLIYRYKPYMCLALKPIEVEFEDGLDGLWSATIPYQAKCSPSPSSSPDNRFPRLDDQKVMYAYGVSALWYNVGQSPKSYSLASVVYSASKDVYRPAHKWTIRDEKNDNLVHMYFIEATTPPQQQEKTSLSLEMIQIQSMKTNNITRTVNILSLSKSLSNEDDAYENQLQVPVGYGCVNLEATEKAKVEFPQLNQLYFGPLMETSHRLEIEATATKYDGISGKEGRSSDTISVELIRTNVSLSSSSTSGGGGTIQLIRQRSTGSDIKTIAHHPFNVQYRIDLRQGTCELKNMGKISDSSIGDRLSLYFANGLTLDMEHKTMREIFVTPDDYYFIKRVKRSSSGEYLIFERSGLSGYPMRIIRTYSKVNDMAPLVLESVSIWTFDEKYTKALESYHLNIINAEAIDNLVDLAKLFDVSDDCYLNNDHMKSGKDYAWIELSYALSNRFVEPMSANVDRVKEKVYSAFASQAINFFRVPRMEIMFEDTGFILRILLLDLPSLPLLYDLKPTYSLQIDKEQGDLEELAVDLEHCADLCRLSKCKTMSYSAQNHVCLLSTEWPQDDENKLEGQRKLIRNQSFKTYLMPRSGRFNFARSSLHAILSMLRHQDYDPVTTLPSLPDELAYPGSETGVDAETYRRITIDYLSNVSRFLTDEAHKLPLLTMAIDIDGTFLILVANKFELEQDPLEEFDLADKIPSLRDDSSGGEEEEMGDDQSQQAASGGGGARRFSGGSVPAFHEGLKMQRYKMSSIVGGGSRRARLFSSLNYDQCALACIDSDCNSFSYCSHRQECILTNIYDIGNITNSLLEPDIDCFIAQRDYLSKFNKFGGVYLSSVYESMERVHNAAECAHACVSTRKGCLAFDYCEEQPASKDANSLPKQTLASCYFLKDRFLHTIASGKPLVSDNIKFGGRCDHYSRSYLADFVRIEYRKIDEAAMAELKTIPFEGRSVDQCADLCANEFIDCSAFQFCFDPDASGAMQKCTLIEGRRFSQSITNSPDYRVLINLTAEEGEQLVEVGKIFKPNEDCHVFTLSRTSNEARLRDLALSADYVDTNNNSNDNKSTGDLNNGGLTLGGSLLLYVCLTMVFAAIGCGVCLAKHHNDYIRQKIERIQLLLRL